MDEKKNIGLLFDRIAKSYDKLNHLLSLNIDKRWRRKAVKELRACEKCLDVAIGTADLTIEMLRRKKVERVVGIDLSEEMMKIGEQKVKAAGYEERVTMKQDSALAMSFDDEQFDCVTCSFGVRNFSDLDKGLSEMWRVLKTEGQLMILEFSYPKNGFVAWVYDVYFSHLLPKIGRWISKDKTAYTYLNKSVKQFVWGEAMVEHLQKAGFREIRYKTLSFGIATIYTAQR